MSIAARWFDGLVTRDVGITNEVYSIHSIDFDRQVSQLSYHLSLVYHAI